MFLCQGWHKYRTHTLKHEWSNYPKGQNRNCDGISKRFIATLIISDQAVAKESLEKNQVYHDWSPINSIVKTFWLTGLEEFPVAASYVSKTL